MNKQDIESIIKEIEESYDHENDGLWIGGSYLKIKLLVKLAKLYLSYCDKMPDKIEPGVICSWLKTGREYDIYIDGYNSAIHRCEPIVMRLTEENEKLKNSAQFRRVEGQQKEIERLSLENEQLKSKIKEIGGEV